ncbi:ABC transporter permease [Methylobacter sp. YRD-M1]|uniref:ABC transporter permease n=1 Tax=Methylobacter sp. YRD-M1 TaxID=2911520 RepID=UPI00227B6318|nr:ABC transporter permease [Methylobacter sp. YRD-M1]WAK03781.1 ABC transporter permease [Methylobacter sp. YRD-M1]
MIDFERWAELGQSLSKHKLRTGLTAFGVSWGIFMLVLLLGMGKGLERGTMTLFQDTALNSVWIGGGKTSQSYKGLTPGRTVGLEIDDVALLDNLPGVEAVGPTKLLDKGYVMRYGKNTGAFQINGISAVNAEIQKLALLSGRQINQLDERESRKVAIIGARVNDVLMKNQLNPVGKTIYVGETPFTVIGVYNKALGEQSPNRVYIPYATLRQVFDPAPTVNMLALTVSSGYSWPDLKPEVVRLLSQRHRFDPNDSAALEIYDISDEVKKVESLMSGIRLFMIIVGTGTLMAGCVGVSNTMLVTVKERTREFGIRKAIGASSADILFMVLHETLVITLVAGYVGLLAGVGLVELISQAGIESDYFRDPQVDLSIAVSALGVLILAGLIAGYLPARQAVRVSPIEALRHE